MHPPPDTLINQGEHYVTPQSAKQLSSSTPWLSWRAGKAIIARTQEVSLTRLDRGQMQCIQRFEAQTMQLSGARFDIRLQEHKRRRFSQSFQSIFLAGQVRVLLTSNTNASEDNNSTLLESHKA